MGEAKGKSADAQKVGGQASTEGRLLVLPKCQGLSTHLRSEQIARNTWELSCLTETIIYQEYSIFTESVS